MDAQVIRPAGTNSLARDSGYATQPPLQRFLTSCYEEFRGDESGVVADYIPELQRANPAHFGISLVTIDGHVYEVGDSAVPFTIQSVSKAFVFALALEMVGEERVAAAIGVEPSGEAFNSIRLTNDNRPFNPMVNAGAIACSGLIHRGRWRGVVRANSREAEPSLPAASSGSTMRLRFRSCSPATGIARSPGCCGIIRCSRATWMPCWIPIFANAPCWSPRAISP